MTKRKKKNDIYYLDTASLSVKKVRVSVRQRLFRLLRYLIVCAFLVGIAFYTEQDLSAGLFKIK